MPEFNTESEQPGQMGELLVRANGEMQLQIGDLVFDIEKGAECMFPQDVVAVDVAAQSLVVLGRVASKFVVSPNISCLFECSFAGRCDINSQRIQALVASMYWILRLWVRELLLIALIRA